MKIQTPRQFALLMAFLLSILVIGIVVLVEVISGVDISILAILIASVICFGVGYVIIYYLLERLITSKIRLLFRIIHNQKISKGDFAIEMSDDVLEKSEREVMNWKDLKQEEIEKLKEQEEFRREFLGNLAHELRTPIFSIQGYILTLLEGGLEDESINRKFLERASKGVDRMTGIIEDLDVITRIESERLKFVIEPVDIVKLAKEVMEDRELKAEHNKIKLTFNKDYPVPIEVLCDRDKIDQVMQNLINNSINYGVEGGETEVRFFDLEDNILIEVSDNGVGIAEDKLPRLFERFYRVDKSRARNEGGTGLGLAIVKHIIEGHGQTINVRSTEGAGSTFAFTLRKAK